MEIIATFQENLWKSISNTPKIEAFNPNLGVKLLIFLNSTKMWIKISNVFTVQLSRHNNHFPNRKKQNIWEDIKMGGGGFTPGIAKG